MPAASPKNAAGPPQPPAETTRAPEPTGPGASPSPRPDAKAPAEPVLRNFEYWWPTSTVYQHIPLTAHAALPAEPAVEADRDHLAVPAVPARPATVYAFADPPDGRWRETDLPVNQAPDNEPPPTAEGV